MHRFVPKQETCRLLKEAGMPQGGGEFYWCEVPFASNGLLLYKKELETQYYEFNVKSKVRAPLTDELLKFPGVQEFIMDWLEGDDNPNPVIQIGKAVRRAGFTRALTQKNIPESLAKLCLELRKEGVGLW